jgi:ElaB/YqjD/DUF883 family membrane-anchored ribosome-binding protein
MSINERINQELETLHKELEDLRHYSVQIGEAGQAAKQLSEATREFVTHYAEQVGKVTGALDEAASHFTSTTKALSKDFDDAGNVFQSGIQDAGNTFREGIERASTSLAEVEERLQEASGQVSQMSSRIEAMNIPEQFRRVQDSLLAIERQQNAQGSDFSARLTGLESTLSAMKNRMNTLIYLVIALALIVVAQLVLAFM